VELKSVELVLSHDELQAWRRQVSQIVFVHAT
jgi:hypothetical protein